MKRYRRWALVAVYHEHEAEDLADSDEQIRDMSVMDWEWDATVNTMVEVEVKPGEWKVIASEQPSPFGEEVSK
jgi:hypothetical protein